MIADIPILKVGIVHHVLFALFFDKYEQTGGMGGQEYTYAFRAEAVAD